MRWQNIQLILTREVRDQLRDRRTLFMIAVLPLLLYPSLGIGMMSMMSMFADRERTVVVLGDAHLPETPLIDGERFVPSLFSGGTKEAEKLVVLTETRLSAGSETAAQREAHARLLTKARMIRLKVEQRQETDNPERLAVLNDDLNRLFAQSGMQVLIVIPDGFAEHIERVNRQIASRSPEPQAAADVDYPRPLIVKNRANDGSEIAYARVKEVIDAWEQQILKKRLVEARLPQSLSEPIQIEPVDLAESSQISASVWSKIFPALLVIMSVTGAFYPAVDLVAGEKERGTMETLLICPALRGEIVIGKFLTVMLFSMSTALLNLLSMGLTGKYMASMGTGGALGRLGTLETPSLGAMVWIVVLLVPLSSLFSALCLSLATFARSTKEGQYYLTPLLMITLGLTVICLSPGVTIQLFYSVMPVVGPALLLKELLASGGQAAPLEYVLPVLITSIGYSLLALWWAIDQFSREDVLFREAERFELRLWIRHLLRDKEPTPSFAEAGFCFVMIMLLQFAAIRFFQVPLADASPAERGTQLIQLLMIQQLAIIASPALFMGVMLTTDVLKTFRLRWPSWRMLAVAGALPFVLHPLSFELSALLQERFFPPLPSQIVDNLRTMTDVDQPLWLVLLAFAVAPAVCEELAFRGFVLSGFQRSGRTWLAIVLSSVTFGIMHMLPQQVFNAALVGLVLGLIAVRSGSLLACVLFHFSYNAIEIVRGRIGELDPGWLTTAPAEWLVRLDGGAIRYEWTTLLLAGGIAIALLRWLVQAGTVQNTPTGDGREPEPMRVGQKPQSARL